MGARAEQARLGLHAADGAQEDLAPAGVVEPRVECARLGRGADGALDCHERGDVEPGGRDLALELVGAMEVGRGEPARVIAGVAVLAIGEVALDDRLEARLEQEALATPSKVDAKRVMAAAASRPPGRSARRASCRARLRSAASVRW